jgi:putative peptide zinc metalloprotease protein
VRLRSQHRQFSTVRAKSLRKPQLRGDLNISEQETSEQLSYVIKVPGKNSYFRYGPLEYEILELCNGDRTPAEIAGEMIIRHPAVQLSESHVIDFLDTVESILWERTRIERNLAVLERIRAERTQQIDHSSLLNIRFRPWNPDKFLEAVNRYAGWVFTKGFALASIGFVLLTIYLLGANWSRIVDDTEALYNFEGRSYFDIVWFWLLLLALEFIHEFGHGLVCKHFGGEVPEMGFSLVYFTPSLYLDTSHMLLFGRRQRYLVIFAGVWIEFIVCGIAMLIWSAGFPGTFLNDLAYKTVLLTGIDALAWNLNPLIQADGYYALADYLGIDNLAERSQEYLWAWIRIYLLRMDLELPPTSRRDRRIFLSLSIGALVNTMVLVGGGLLLLNNILEAQFGSLGNVFALLVVCLLAKKYVAVCFNAGKNWISQWRGNHMTWKPSQLQKVAAFGIVALVFVPPFPTHVTSDFVLEPATKTWVRPKVEGKVSEVYVTEGTTVRAGQALALLENPEVESNAGILSREIALAGGGVRSSEYQYDASRAAEANRTRSRLQSAFTVARERQSALRISAPMDGVVATPMLEQKEGEFLAAGQDFCQIVDRRKLRARILVHDWDVPDIQPGADAQLKMEAFPFRTYYGKVERVLPAMAKDSPPLSELDEPKHAEQQLTNYMTLLVTVSNADGVLRENMTGTAKISATRRSLAWLAARDAWRWVRRQIY